MINLWQCQESSCESVFVRQPAQPELLFQGSVFQVHEKCLAIQAKAQQNKWGHADASVAQLKLSFSSFILITKIGQTCVRMHARRMREYKLYTWPVNFT